jgi:ATP-dependent helicase HepA
VSPEYAFVESLGRKTSGLLLLTATPEQLGLASHFARLRLLDEDRFFDLEEFVRETQHYREVARSAEQLLGSEELDVLLDQHGTGRVTFRNTRVTISGFPRRIVQLIPLEPPNHVHSEFNVLVEWLVEFLRFVDPAKVLLICRTQAKVASIEVAIRQRSRNLKVAVFHEGLSLIQRDRNAAWFAEDNGARVLLCSEIGGEGRNFQFAHHLVLFDLPLDPELLEQRIGRLDRIGQRSEIYVYAPYVRGGAHEVLARWHHEGLNAFERNLAGGRELFERFGASVYSLAERYSQIPEESAAELDRLIIDTRTVRAEITERLHEGRDRLLELSSFRPAAAEHLISEIRQQDRDASLDEFMLAILDLYSITVEDLGPRTYKLGSAGMLADSFPGLPADGFSVTCRRELALAREDIQFLTWDHPLVTGALDLLLGAEKGNSSFALWVDSRETAMYVETVYLLECVAPPHLHADRFLPPTPIRALVDHRGEDRGKVIPEGMLEGRLKSAEPEVLFEYPELRQGLSSLIERCRGIAERQAVEIVGMAREEMHIQLRREIERLKELQKVNKSVRPEEIELLVSQQRELDQWLGAARVRLDAVRLIQGGADQSKKDGRS